MRSGSRHVAIIWLSACLAACNEHGSQPPPPDVFVPPPPPTGFVSLRIALDDATPMPGVSVIFEDANGTQSEVATTDGSGLARVRMQDGGVVTAINPFGPESGVDDLRTFVEVRIGDELTLVGPTAPITVEVSAPLDPGAKTYQLHSTCGSGTLVSPGGTGVPSGAISLRGCRGITDMLVETFDSAGAPHSSLYQAGQVVTDGRTLQLTGAYAPVASSRVTFSGVPDRFDHADTRSMVLSIHGTVFEGPAFSTPIQLGNGQHAFELPTAGTPATLTRATFDAAGTTIPVHGVLQWGPPATDSFIDLFDDLLPEYLSAPELVSPRDIVWTEPFFAAPFAATPFEVFDSAPPPRPAADFILATLQIVRSSGTTRTWRWRIVTPYRGAAVKYPELPRGPGFDFNMDASDTITVTELTTMTIPGGYRAARATVLNTRRPEELISDPTGGRIIFQQLR